VDKSATAQSKQQRERTRHGVGRDDLLDVGHGSGCGSGADGRRVEAQLGTSGSLVAGQQQEKRPGGGRAQGRGAPGPRRHSFARRASDRRGSGHSATVDGDKRGVAAAAIAGAWPGRASGGLRKT